MRDFDESTLWRVSEFDRARERGGGSAFTRLEGRSLLPSTLLTDLRQVDPDGSPSADPLEILASCIRHREPAMLCLRYDGLVWPVTVFPNESLYHSPRDFAEAQPAAIGQIALLTAEPPGVRPPGHWMHAREAPVALYRPLAPLLWALAVHGPRERLLGEIAGTAAYRAVRDVDDDGGVLRGVLRSALSRLRRETVALREIASWPGMSTGRAARLLNGLYLSSALLSTRAHPAARPEPRTLWPNSRR